LRQVCGGLGYVRGAYQVLLDAAPLVDAGLAGRRQATLKRAPKTAGAGGFNFLQLATFNLENLFDLQDDPAREDPVPRLAAYQRQLAKLAGALHGPMGEPALVAVQEVENDRVLSDLVSRPEVQTPYQAVWVEGPDARGIDVALLYDPRRVVLRGYQTHQACTRLQDGLGPDGNRDVQNPLNAATCDVDGDGHDDGNRLFSRPPLAVRVQVCPQSCSPTATGPPLDLWVVVNHWKSKSQDTPWNEHTLARRTEQAQAVVQLIDHLRIFEPGTPVVVLGDLNDLPGSEPLERLAQSGLVNLLPSLHRSTRYTYIYQGVSQVLDHVLVSPELAGQVVKVEVLHLNADYPAALEADIHSPLRSSDHDPVLVWMQFPAYRQYLPFGLRAD
jgi:predicted extracellular nuclease